MNIHVHPGSKFSRVGGTHDSSLVVRVTSHAVGGAATSEVLRVVAQAFGISTSALTLVRGSHSREKVIEVAGLEAQLIVRLHELLSL